MYLLNADGGEEFAPASGTIIAWMRRCDRMAFFLPGETRLCRVTPEPASKLLLDGGKEDDFRAYAEILAKPYGLRLEPTICPLASEHHEPAFRFI